MNEINKTTNDPVWEMIEKERKRDLLVKRVSRVAWAITLIVLSIFLIFTIQDYLQMQRLYQNGAVSKASVTETVVPFLVILGSLSLVVAVLATVGMFLRLRTTSLLEVQQRLANLEQMITSEKS